MGLRLRSNAASRPLPRKPSGQRVFCFWALLSHASQPAVGMLRLLRLAQNQNPSPQHRSQFSDRLLLLEHSFSLNGFWHAAEFRFG